jgi:hypothetical protein
MPPPETTETANALLTQRVCRVMLDLKVQVTEVTAEILRQSIFWDEMDQSRSFTFAERQNYFLKALLRDKEALQQFLAYVAMSDLRYRLDADLIVSAPIQDEDSILKSVLARLSPEEADQICDDASAPAIGEDIELLHRCFSIRWNESVLARLEVVPKNTDLKQKKG